MFRQVNELDWSGSGYDNLLRLLDIIPLEQFWLFRF